MTATTPFTESKVTDAAGVISYRVGGVFAAGGNNPSRVSVTVICSPGGGPLALVIVRTNAPASLKSGAAPVVTRVDDVVAATMNSERMVNNGLASYEVKAGASAEVLVARMSAGQKLLLDLDEFSAELPLTGFAAEMRDLTAACPHH
jgi:hypothetical protein